MPDQRRISDAPNGGHEERRVRHFSAFGVWPAGPVQTWRHAVEFAVGVCGEAGAGCEGHLTSSFVAHGALPWPVPLTVNARKAKGTRLRSRTSAGHRDTSVLPHRTEPRVGRSVPVRRCGRVVLMEPEDSIAAVHIPGARVTGPPRSASTAVVARPYSWCGAPERAAGLLPWTCRACEACGGVTPSQGPRVPGR